MRHQRNPDVVITPFSEIISTVVFCWLGIDSIMQRSIYTTIETLVPRSDVGGLENSNYYLQIFGEKGKSRKVIPIFVIDILELGNCITKIELRCLFQ